MTELQVNILTMMCILESIIFCTCAAITEGDKKSIILILCINGTIAILLEILFFGYCLFSSIL